MEQTLVGTNPDGTPLYNYDYSGPEGGGLLVTGPTVGTVTLDDGTVYDVTPEVIEHAPGHAVPLMEAIQKLYDEQKPVS